MTDNNHFSGNGIANQITAAPSSNFIACDAITSKLTEVSKIAESLDFILKDLQQCIDHEESSISSDGKKFERSANVNDSRGSADVRQKKKKKIHFNIL